MYKTRSSKGAKASERSDSGGTPRQTRSGIKQVHIEDYEVPKESKSPYETRQTKKLTRLSVASPGKKAAPEHLTPHEVELKPPPTPSKRRRVKDEAKKDEGKESEAKPESGKSVVVNRAPVLTLWAAIVSQAQGYSRDEALSYGR